MTGFSQPIWDYYRAHGRAMPWREEPTFYNVLVSEIMLQQTQVQRVIPKFSEFMAAFPTIKALAEASLADVLRVWQGLGYNRRAKFLHDAAKMIQADAIPSTMEALTALPGVGSNTAAAIMNYAYDVPVPFVETNIRTVYFYYYFEGQTDVTDKEVYELVKSTMPKENSREWFWALMDYGAFLKSQGAAELSASRHYKKQTRFEGSVRQIRGRILSTLANGDLSDQQLRTTVGAEDGLYAAALTGLLHDGLVQKSARQYHLTK